MRCSLVLAAAISLLSSPAGAADPSERNERCARRIATVLVAAPKPWTIPAAMMNDPQQVVDELLKTTAFIGRFAAFIDSKFNRTPSQISVQNAAYWMAMHVLTNGLPWKEMFIGKWGVRSNNGGAYPVISPDPNGLGYFRFDGWQRRYAGNEQEGYKLLTAYRMMQNVVGLDLVAAANNAVGDNTATGRQRAECRSCHFDSAFALDKVARVLTRRQGFGAQLTFVPPTDGPQTLFNGVTVHDDAELVSTMVSSTQFRFHACRLAFEYLYGRPENTCEALVFDRCMAAFAAEQTMQSAIAAIAKDPSFCE